MTRKKISQVPKESLSQANTDYTDYFLEQIGHIFWINVVLL